MNIRPIFIIIIAITFASVLFTFIDSITNISATDRMCDNIPM